MCDVSINRGKAHSNITVCCCACTLGALLNDDASGDKPPDLPSLLAQSFDLADSRFKQPRLFGVVSSTAMQNWA